jgi:diadenosine tetraphosphate (Ap4A) HIT family hydrolase
LNQEQPLTAFTLHPQLSTDSLPVAELSLSTVRLMRDANYPWLLLVPRIEAIDVADMTPPDRAALMDEIVKASTALRETVPCDKLNIATLGNAVAQMHVHVIARRRNDISWPKPVWGAAPAKAYQPGEGEALAAKLAARLK